ncbi:CDC27 protein [Tieghemiomyces parasiticus]|uniref:DNA polymerase delta subunit 3 n=1 Tax=Tieghemiomyces parasiticus TaxID=78921 RepID=A0A9W8E138_9FUNG|nr:CDC27 protein [Tieghemiomyces parasiticus]
MTTDYHELLTTRIFHEQRPATYSWLGRTLDVQVNEAKCMLYEFHQSRLNNTDGKPACEAVYCVAGRPRKLDVSTPTPSNSQGTDAALARIAYSYVLTPEADLAATKERFRAVISVHIWSLQAKIPLASDSLVGVRVEERSEYARSDLAEEVQAGQAVSGIAVRADDDDAGPNPVEARGAGVKPHDKLLVVQLNDGNQTKPAPFQAAAKAETKQEITSKPAPKMSPIKTAKCNDPDTSEAATGKAKLPGGFFKAQGKKKAAAKAEPTPESPSAEETKR